MDSFLSIEQAKASRFQEIIENEKLKLLYQYSTYAVPANILNATIVFLVLYLTNKSTLLLIWFAAVILHGLLRLLGNYYYKIYPNRMLQSLLFDLGAVLGAALWGFASSVLIPKQDLLAELILIAVALGSVAGGIQVLVPSLFACMSWVILILLPLNIWLYLQAGELRYLILAILTTNYFIYMLITAWKSNARLVALLTLTYTNKELAENTNQLNHSLTIALNKSQKHDSEQILINKLNETLQICDTPLEAYPRISLFAQQLLPNLSGGLSIFDKTANLMQTVEEWGEEKLLEEKFVPNDCFGIRSGNANVVDNPKKVINCAHYIHLPLGGYMGLPMVTRGELIGIIHLFAKPEEVITKHQQRNALSLTNVVKLSLVNIQLRQMLYEASIRDPLTQLFNRRYLNETLPREIERCKRKESSLCIAMMDIDFFKKFNDEYGHDAGDEVLKFIGQLLLNQFRESDIACRYGGEEFCIVLSDTDFKSALSRLERLHKKIKSAHLYFQGNKLPIITVSIGMAMYPQDGITIENLIQCADNALYLAKNMGRDRIKFNGTT